ncbi:DEAD-box ATP-dependent RNA helicase 40 [Durusdinium trenchii]|uniref:DEAD-box ATP-dependent RNA helicase 40 n=1 Tax=Durusdinium trenchii TaxID=1381693 RepID=A0ABP0L8M4_9DINO
MSLSSMESGEEDSIEEELLEPRPPNLLQRGLCAVSGALAIGFVMLMMSGHRQAFLYKMPAMNHMAGLDDAEDLTRTRYGTVDEGIYTFGAPGTASRALPDLSHEDGCFAGLRVWAEDVLPGNTKQEDGAAISDQLDHPHVATLRLHDEQHDSHYKPCPGEQKEPFSTGNKFAEWRLHWEPIYKPRLGNVSLLGKKVANQAPFSVAYGYNRIAYKQYDSTEHAKAHIQQRLGESWKIVARWTLVQGSASMYDEDPLMLVQDSETQRCVLAFAGINNYGNELATATDVRTSDFCGFEGVHVGYRDELRRIMQFVFPHVRPLMGKCSHVACTGHSMGGSLCDLFAACANSQRFEDPDFKAVSWLKETPAVLPEISDCGGVHYSEEAEHRCQCPPCPKSSFLQGRQTQHEENGSSSLLTVTLTTVPTVSRSELISADALNPRDLTPLGTEVSMKSKTSKGSSAWTNALAAALAALGGLAPRAPARTEERLVGRIKRFMDVPNGYGYGFIDCEETKLRFSRDVYLHRNQMEGLQIGDEVSFSLMFNSKGEPQARNVTKLEDMVTQPLVVKVGERKMRFCAPLVRRHTSPRDAQASSVTSFNEATNGTIRVMLLSISGIELCTVDVPAEITVRGLKDQVFRTGACSVTVADQICFGAEIWAEESQPFKQLDAAEHQVEVTWVKKEGSRQEGDCFFYTGPSVQNLTPESSIEHGALCRIVLAPDKITRDYCHVEFPDSRSARTKFMVHQEQLSRSAPQPPTVAELKDQGVKVGERFFYGGPLRFQGLGILRSGALGEVVDAGLIEGSVRLHFHGFPALCSVEHQHLWTQMPPSRLAELWDRWLWHPLKGLQSPAHRHAPQSPSLYDLLPRSLRWALRSSGGKVLLLFALCFLPVLARRFAGRVRLRQLMLKTMRRSNGS